MIIAFQEDRDVSLARSLTMAAGRRGHVAKHVASLHEIPRVLPADPEVVVIGAGRLDRLTLERIEEARSQYERTLILLVVEQATASDTMTALELGAGYVLLKPVTPSEVVGWLERLPELRLSTPRRRCIADLEIELDEMRVKKAGRELPLTRSEFYLLSCLVEYTGRVTSIERLLKLDSEIDEMAYSSLKTHVSRLRRKLQLAGGTPIRISAKQLLGYVLEVAGAPGAGADRGDLTSARPGQARDASPSGRFGAPSAHVRPDVARASGTIPSLTLA